MQREIEIEESREEATEKESTAKMAQKNNIGIDLGWNDIFANI